MTTYKPERVQGIYESPAAWLSEARRRFGDDKMKWAFLCPSCGHRATVADWKEVGATEGEIAFSCIGRHIKGAGELGCSPGPCNYAGGGLFALNPVSITLEDGGVTTRFAFADPEEHLP